MTRPNLSLLYRLGAFYRSPAGRLLIGFLRSQKRWVFTLFALSNLTAIAVSLRVVLFVSFLQVLASEKSVTELAIPIPGLKTITSLPVLAGYDSRAAQLTVLLGLVVMLSITSLLLEFTNRRMTAALSVRFTRMLRRLAATHSFKLDASFYAQNRVGEIGNMLFSPVGVITGLLMNMQQVMTSLLQITGVLAVIVYLAPLLTLWMVIVGLLLLSFMTRYHLAQRPLAQELRRLDQEASGALNDNLYGMRVIKQAGQETRARNRFLRISARVDSQNVKLINAKTLGAMIIQAGGMVAIVAIAMLVTLLHGINLIKDIGFALGYFMALWRLYNEIYTAFAVYSEMVQHLPYLSNLAIVLNDETHLETRIFGSGRQRDLGFKKAVSIERLNFSYDAVRQVLRNIDLQFRVGTVTALVGLSGSGKTTLLELLARFRAPQDGRILVDDTDMRDIDLTWYRRQTGYVNQETILFNDTVADNIRFARPKATQAEVEAAARMAAAHEFIMEMREGYKTPIGERAQKISGGQRQRIVLARAFLQNPRLLLLDEATSALDVLNERIVLTAMRNTIQDKIVLIATHRLITITDVDHIVFIHDGEVIEQGTHQQLMDLHGMYFDLFRFQSEAAEVGLSPDLGL